MRFTFSLVFSLFLLHNPSAQALGLMEAYEAALQNDGQYRTAIYQNEAGQQREAIGKANILPSISASYSYNRIDSSVDSVSNGQPFSVDRNYNSKNAVIQARQPIFNKESWAKYRLGQLETQLSDLELKQNKQILIDRFFTHFAKANYAQDLLALAKAEHASYINQETSNQQLFKLGEGTKTELIESRAKMHVAEAAVIEAENHVANANSAFKNIIGLEYESLDKINESFDQLVLQDDQFEYWSDSAQSYNPELQAFQLKVSVAKQTVKKVQAGHYPQLDAVASISQSSSDSVATFNQDIFNKSFGLQLNIPLYAGGSISAQVLEAKANLKKAEIEFETKKNEIFLDIRQQLNTLQSNSLKIAALQESVSSAALLIEATQKSVLAGFRTNQDVLEARQQRYTAKRDLSVARYNYLVAYVQLQKAAGGLNDDVMAQLAGYFHP